MSSKKLKICFTELRRHHNLSADFMRLNPPSDDQMLSLDGSEIGKVDDFLSLGSYTETSHDIDTRIGKAWGGGGGPQCSF